MTEATGIVGEFLALKESTDADVLAMQCGDFYEFFADDAELVADELDLTVSQKSSHGSSYPMAGVPPPSSHRTSPHWSNGATASPSPTSTRPRTATPGR